jgi:hypothetical protein
VLAEGPLLDTRSVEYLAERLAGLPGVVAVDLIYRDLDEGSTPSRTGSRNPGRTWARWSPTSAPASS